jgi:hypothetical protein
LIRRKIKASSDRDYVQVWSKNPDYVEHLKTVKGVVSPLSFDLAHVDSIGRSCMAGDHSTSRLGTYSWNRVYQFSCSMGGTFYFPWSKSLGFDYCLRTVLNWV